MTERPDLEAWFLANLGFIESTLALVARGQGLRGDEAEEFTAWAKARLCENDYAVLRKWRGNSKLGTYVVAVATTLGREYRVREWGRWRASAAAQRLGPAAVLLERLVYRDGLRPHEAAEWLRTGGWTSLSDRAIGELLARLPVRVRPRRVDADTPVDAVADCTASDEMDNAETAAEWHAVLQALDAALGRLEPREEAVIRMHFLHAQTLADVARALDLEQRPLYRLRDAALRRLRGFLLDAGVRWERLHELVGGPLAPPGQDDAADPEHAPAGQPPWEHSTSQNTLAGGTARPWPSNQPDDARVSTDLPPSSDPARPERYDA